MILNATFRNPETLQNTNDIMTFEQYLGEKKINYETFLWDDPQEYERLKTTFNLSHPESFTAQKKFLINKLRRKYVVKTF
jgi:hypothetical protein